MKYPKADELVDEYMRLYDEVPDEKKRTVAYDCYSLLLEQLLEMCDDVARLHNENIQLKQVLYSHSAGGTSNVIETVQLGLIISALQGLKKDVARKQEEDKQSANGHNKRSAGGKRSAKD